MGVGGWDKRDARFSIVLVSAFSSLDLVRVFRVRALYTHREVLVTCFCYFNQLLRERNNNKLVKLKSG